MDLNSAGNPPKRSRSKPKADAAVTPATSRTRKASATQDASAIQVTSIMAMSKPGEEELLGMIATAAYYIAEHRDFEPGHELEDWLEAERQIRTLHT